MDDYEMPDSELAFCHDEEQAYRYRMISVDYRTSTQAEDYPVDATTSQ